MAETRKQRERVFRDPTMRIDFVLVGVSCLLLAWVLTGVFSTEPVSASASQSRTEIGTLQELANDVRRRHDGDLVWDALVTNARLFSRDAIYVAEGSSATIALETGGKIHIDERSLVILQKRTSDQGVGAALALDILRGGVAGDAGNGTLEIKSGKMLLTVAKGSAVRVRVRKDKSARVTVAKGRARMRGAAGEVILTSGERQRFDASGKRKGRLEKLEINLLRPAEGERVYTSATAAVIFTWQRGTAKGTEYLLEVSRDADFTVEVRAVTVTEPKATVTGLVPGTYTWRVSRRTETINPAVSAERGLVIVLDEPPKVYRPVSASVVDLSSKGSNLALAWTEVKGASAYELVIYRGDNFDAPLIKQRAKRPSALIRREAITEEGRHCFRVRIVDREGAPWSAARCFRLILLPILRAPTLFDLDAGRGARPGGAAQPEESGSDSGAAPAPAPKEGGGQRGSLFFWLFGSVAHAQGAPKPITLRWEKIAGATAYMVEIATSQAFEKPLVSKRVDANYFRWLPPVRRDYYWRVRAVDAHGRLGKVSSPRLLALAVPKPRLQAPKDSALVAFKSGPPSVPLAWAAATGITTYEVEIAPTPRFDTGVERSKVDGTSLVFKPKRPGVYHWRVFSISPGGGRSEATASRKLTAYVAPPVLVAPKGEASFVLEGSEVEVSLKWDRRPVGRYDVELARDREFKDSLGRHATNSTSYEVALTAAGKIFWRARGVNPTTQWSGSRTFNVGLKGPILIAPAPGLAATVANGQTEAKVNLTWEKVAGALSYIVEVAVDVAGEAKSHAATETSVEINLPDGSYTWKVVALGEGNIRSVPSETRPFVVGKEIVVKSGDGKREDGKNGAGKNGAVVGKTLQPGWPNVFYVGPRIAFYTNFGTVVSPRFGIGLGYRPPVLSGLLRFAITGTYYTASTRIIGDSRVRSNLHAVPLQLIAYVQVPPSLLAGFDFFDLFAGIALDLTISYATVTISTESPQETTSLLVGTVLIFGIERWLGIGGLFAEIGFSYGSSSGGLVEHDSSGFALTAGYRFYVW